MSEKKGEENPKTNKNRYQRDDHFIYKERKYWVSIDSKMLVVFKKILVTIDKIPAPK